MKLLRVHSQAYPHQHPHFKKAETTDAVLSLGFWLLAGAALISAVAAFWYLVTPSEKRPSHASH